MSILRSVVVWTIRIIGSVLLLVVGVIGLALLLMHTDWGRDQIRQKVQTIASEQLNGDISIGAIEGSLLSDFTLRDVEITNEDGEVIVAADALGVDYELLDLLDRNVIVNEIDVRGLLVRARQDEEGQLNLAKLVKEKEEDNQPEGPPWTISLQDIEVRSKQLSLQTADGQVRELRDAYVTAGVHVDDGVIEVSDLLARARRSVIEVPSLRYGGEEAGGSFEVFLAATDLRELYPNFTQRADLWLRGEAQQAEAMVWAVNASGTMAQSPFSLEVRADLEKPGGSGHFEMHRVDPSRIVVGAPDGEISAKLEASAAGTELPTLEANVDLELDGRLRDVRFDRAKIQVGRRRRPRRSRRGHRDAGGVGQGVSGGEARSRKSTAGAGRAARTGAGAQRAARRGAGVGPPRDRR